MESVVFFLEKIRVLASYLGTSNYMVKSCEIVFQTSRRINDTDFSCDISLWRIQSTALNATLDGYKNFPLCENPDFGLFSGYINESYLR